MALAAPVAPPPGTQASGQTTMASNETLVAENTAAAAANAVGSLVRALAGEQPSTPASTTPASGTPALRAGGPPVDQILRDLLRPLVKGWMDQMLPDLVERMVRAEVRRIVGNAG